MGLRKRHKLRKQPALSYKSVHEDHISRLGRSSRSAYAAGGCKRSGCSCNKRSCKSTSTKLHGVISFAVRWSHQSMSDAKARGSCRQRGETIC